MVKTNIDNNLYPKELLISAYDLMILIRRFEERAAAAYGMGLIAGFCHLYIGQEAVVVGVTKAIKEGDAMITSYRDHGHILAVGTPAKEVMAELFGRATGVSRGKGGSMHLFDTKRGFYGGHGIVAAQVPIGSGVAFALKYQKKDNIAVTFLGDGAANQGQVYESFNMASLWNLPALYIIENNIYGMGTSIDRAASTSKFYTRGEAFGIKGEIVDGMDFFAVYEATKRAAEYVRSGKGPYILEMKTYRYRGHSMSDPGKYRSKEEVQKYKEQYDPIDNLKKYMISNNLVKEADFKKNQENVKKIVLEAFEFAKSSPEPLASELLTDVLRGEDD